MESRPPMTDEDKRFQPVTRFKDDFDRRLVAHAAGRLMITDAGQPV